MPGVDGIFSSTPERPVPVPDQAIDGIRAQCWANDCVYPPSHGGRPAAPLAVGIRARMRDGPLRELPGICQMSDGHRVRLLMEIMGRAVPVTVLQSAVEVV
jgi:transcription antitermination factor NusG